MNINKLNPWNWFKHEEEQDKKNNVPIKCNDQISAQHTFNNTMQLHQEIDRLFDDAFRGFTSINHSPLWDKIMDSDFTLTFRANVNISSSDKQYTITLEAPGMEQKDLSIEIQDRVLLLKGNKQKEHEEKDQNFYRIERHYGRFERVLSLPEDSNADEISATMKNGLLTLTIPRMERTKSYATPIKINN